MTQYRVWWVINPPNKPVYTTVASPREGLELIQSEIQHQLKMSDVYSNAFGMEEYSQEFGWTEWYDDEGRSIDDENVEVGD